jgi:hypothetical protein
MRYGRVAAQKARRDASIFDKEVTVQINSIIVGAVTILWSAIVGLAIIAFGQVLLAVREIAINTRKDGSAHPHYEILLIMAKINNILGWIFLVVGVALGIYFAVAGGPIILPATFKTSTVL